MGIVQSCETARPESALQPDSVQTRLVAQMGANPVHSDDLARQLGLPSQEVAAALTLLELNDVVRSVGNMQFILSPRWRSNQT
jgi:predicted Rossmann fold nucleotide-binding protein DprA/Smf involved in DNA uptake